MSHTNQGFLIAQAVPTTGKQPAPPSTESKTTTSSTGKEAPKGEAEGPGGFSPLLFPVLLIVVFYFLLIRPQQKREKKKKEMLKELQKGDKVVTRGGLWGVVVGLKEEAGVAVVKIASDVKVEVSTSAIELVNPQAEEVKEKK